MTMATINIYYVYYHVPSPLPSLQRKLLKHKKEKQHIKEGRKEGKTIETDKERSARREGEKERVRKRK